MQQFFTVSDVARRLGVNPRLISDLLYQRKLDESRCSVVGGRRLIPEDYVPEIAKVLGVNAEFVKSSVPSKSADANSAS